MTPFELLDGLYELKEFLLNQHDTEEHIATVAILIKALLRWMIEHPQILDDEVIL